MEKGLKEVKVSIPYQSYVMLGALAALVPSKSHGDIINECLTPYLIEELSKKGVRISIERPPHG